MLINFQEFRDYVGYLPINILNIFPLIKYLYLAVSLPAKGDVIVHFSVSKNIFCTLFCHRMEEEFSSVTTLLFRNCNLSSLRTVIFQENKNHTTNNTLNKR